MLRIQYLIPLNIFPLSLKLKESFHPLFQYPIGTGEESTNEIWDRNKIERQRETQNDNRDKKMTENDKICEENFVCLHYLKPLFNHIKQDFQEYFAIGLDARIKKN